MAEVVARLVQGLGGTADFGGPHQTQNAIAQVIELEQDEYGEEKGKNRGDQRGHRGTRVFEKGGPRRAGVLGDFDFGRLGAFLGVAYL